MGFRETLNQNPAIATGATIAVIVIAVGFIIYSQMGSSTPKPSTHAFYTVDDGATYFPDDAKKIAPFDHEGKEAVKARVYKCADGKEFVGYLERYTPDAKKKLEELRAITSTKDADKQAAARKGVQLQGLAMAAQMGVEVKKPGDANWVPMMDFPNSSRITQIGCPSGNREELQAVNP